MAATGSDLMSGTDIKQVALQDGVREVVSDRVTLYVWHDGDGSVGLPGDRSTVEIDLRSYEQADRRDYIEQVRESLKSSFGAIWDTRPKVMTSDEIRAEEAWLDDGGKVWKLGDIAKFGKNDERDVQVFSGLFRYSGMGMGNYYSASQRVEWIDTTEAQRKSKEEGVRFVYWDAEQAFDPAGYEAQTGDQHVSMPESRFQWWRDQQMAWHKVATALQDHWSSQALEHGVDGAVEVIKMLAKEANAYRALGRPEPMADEVAQALVDVAKEVSPNTINIQAYGSNGELVGSSSRSSSDVHGDLQIMDGAIELVHAIKRGAAIDAAVLYQHLVGDEAAGKVLREIPTSTGLDADDFQP